MTNRAYGMSTGSVTSCQPASRDREPSTSANSTGSPNCRSCPAIRNTSDHGCSRRVPVPPDGSDGIVAAGRKQMIADANRAGVAQTGQLDLRVNGACRIDHQCAECVSPLQRSLRDVGVLNARLRDADGAAPDHAAADFNAVRVDPVKLVAV